MNQNINELVEEIEEHSGNQLKRKKDLSDLIHLGYSNNQKELIEELSFSSKYVQGLFRVLSKASGNKEIQNIGQIKSDLSANLEKVREKINRLLSNADESTRKYFRENYLQLSPQSLWNLTELLSDLEWTKKYFNQVKRDNPN
jgi:hypothetical protein